MTTKLTLTMEDNVIEDAKKYARHKGKSLSKIVETYLKVIGQQEKSNNEISTKVLKLKGVIKLSEGYDYKNELASALSKKYSK
jgi:hypothetical protein